LQLQMPLLLLYNRTQLPVLLIICLRETVNTSAASVANTVTENKVQ